MGHPDNNEVDRTDSPTTLPPADAGADRPAAPSLEAEIQELRKELEEKATEIRASHERFLRERADLENFKKRTQREKSEAVRFANEPLVRELLGVIDNLERALEHADSDRTSVVEGVRMVLKSLLDILARHGVKRIEAVGHPFDPAQHEAMAQVESAEHAPNHVVDQHQSGYLLHDRLLRPALVTVSTRKNPRPVETDPNSD